MARNPVQFGEDDADVLCPGGRLNAQQLLNRFTISEPIRDRGYVVHAVDVGIEHRIGAVLGNLLDAAVQVSDDALKPQDFFAVKSQDNAQYAMGRRMLRAHVDYKLVRVKKRLVGHVEIERRECVGIGHESSLAGGR